MLMQSWLKVENNLILQISLKILISKTSQLFKVSIDTEADVYITESIYGSLLQ